MGSGCAFIHGLILRVGHTVRQARYCNRIYAYCIERNRGYREESGNILGSGSSWLASLSNLSLKCGATNGHSLAVNLRALAWIARYSRMSRSGRLA